MKVIYSSNSLSQLGKKVLRSGMTIMFGGFGLCGIPENLIKMVYDANVTDLTVISNNCGVDDFGLGILLRKNQISKFIGSYVGENSEFEKRCIDKSIDVTLVPQGTLAERIRAGGHGIPGFFTPTGVGTIVEEGKEIREFNGKPCILEVALRADLSLIKAHKADTYGNLIYRKTARNFNPIMATAADFTVAEVEEALEEGQHFDQEHVHTPGIYVDCIFVGICEKRIEKLTLKIKKAG